MSTRSIIGIANDGGFTGRYCHWDGYPTARAVQLLLTYADLGGDWQAVVDYAIKPEELGYWSSYQTPSQAIEYASLPEHVVCRYCEGTGTRRDQVGVDMGMVEKGWCNGCQGTGQAHNPERQQGWTDDGSPLSNASADCGAEWAYLLDERGITILASAYDDGTKAIGMFGSIGATFVWARAGFVAWPTPEDDFDMIVAGIEKIEGAW